MVDNLSEQRRLTEILLSACRGTNIALAGSGAIREYGLINRPTEDIDLFGSTDLLNNKDEFSQILTNIETKLAENQYTITSTTGNDFFRHLEITDGGTLFKVDISVDYRSNPTTLLEIGEVIALEDAVANKVCAVYGRGEARDYLDLDSIRQNGSFSDEELLYLAAQNDLGFDVNVFAKMLTQAENITPDQVERYGVDAAQLEEIKSHYRLWCKQLTPINEAIKNEKHTIAQVAKSAKERAANQTPTYSNLKQQNHRKNFGR